LAYRQGESPEGRRPTPPPARASTPTHRLAREKTPALSPPTIEVGAGQRPLLIVFEPDVTMVVSQHAPSRRSRRDDPIGLPSTWVVARIADKVP
jgi:hypothetical protein